MRVTNLSLPYELIDGHRATRNFSRYPVGVSIADAEVDKALKRIYLEATEPESSERRRAVVRYGNPYGNVFSICHCSAEPERLVLLASIVEIMWIHDDIIEEQDFGTARQEHSILREALRTDIGSISFSPKNVRQRALATVMQSAVDIDPVQAPALVATLQKYLDTYDSLDDDFANMAEYMPYRLANSGYWMSSFFIRWGMGISMSDSDYESIREYDVALGNCLGMHNDYFSWNVEKDQPTDRVRNGVAVLMKEHGVSSDIAQSLLLRMTVEEESRAAELKQQILQGPVSEDVSRYFVAIELYVGGSTYWHSTAPRYQRSE